MGELGRVLMRCLMAEIPEKGIYMADCQVAEPAPSAVDEAIAERLWVLSEELVGEKFDLGRL